MTRPDRPVELAVVPPASETVPAEPPRRDRERAPKRMARRCRRCGKPVPTLSALVWRAERLLGNVDAAARELFQLRVESGAGQEESLKRTHQRQQDGVGEAQKLLADLRSMLNHERRCGDATARSGSPSQRAALRDASAHAARRDRDAPPR